MRFFNRMFGMKVPKGLTSRETPLQLMQNGVDAAVTIAQNRLGKITMAPQAARQIELYELPNVIAGKLAGQTIGRLTPKEAATRELGALSIISNKAQRITRNTVNELGNLTNNADMNADIKRFGKYTAFAGGAGIGVAGAINAFSDDD